MEAATVPTLQLRSRTRLAPMPVAGALRELPGFELRCSDCGYGVVVRMAPDRCPMCRGSVWEHPSRPHRPGTRFR